MHIAHFNIFICKGQEITKFIPARTEAKVQKNDSGHRTHSIWDKGCFPECHFCSNEWFFQELLPIVHLNTFHGKALGTILFNIKVFFFFTAPTAFMNGLSRVIANCPFQYVHVQGAKDNKIYSCTNRSKSTKKWFWTPHTFYSRLRLLPWMLLQQLWMVFLKLLSIAHFNIFNRKAIDIILFNTKVFFFTAPWAVMNSLSRVIAHCPFQYFHLQGAKDNKIYSCTNKSKSTKMILDIAPILFETKVVSLNVVMAVMNGSFRSYCPLHI